MERVAANSDAASGTLRELRSGTAAMQSQTETVAEQAHELGAAAARLRAISTRFRLPNVVELEASDLRRAA